MAKARLGQVIGRLGHGWAPSRLHVGTGYYQKAAIRPYCPNRSHESLAGFYWRRCHIVFPVMFFTWQATGNNTLWRPGSRHKLLRPAD